MLSAFQFHESYLKDTNACDDGNHGDNDENNETAEAIWGPPSPTIDFVQPSVTPAHTHTLSTILTLLLAHSTVLLCSQLGWVLGPILLRAAVQWLMDGLEREQMLPLFTDHPPNIPLLTPYHLISHLTTSTSGDVGTLQYAAWAAINGYPADCQLSQIFYNKTIRDGGISPWH